MQGLGSKFRTLVATLLTRRPVASFGQNSALDWLPPMLGPNDWSLGLMADRSVTWYFERS